MKTPTEKLNTLKALAEDLNDDPDASIGEILAQAAAIQLAVKALIEAKLKARENAQIAKRQRRSDAGGAIPGVDPVGKPYDPGRDT